MNPSRFQIPGVSVTIFVMNICTENSDFKFFKTNKYHSLNFKSCLAADSFLRENFDEKKIEQFWIMVICFRSNSFAPRTLLWRTLWFVIERSFPLEDFFSKVQKTKQIIFPNLFQFCLAKFPSRNLTSTTSRRPRLPKSSSTSSWRLSSRTKSFQSN